MCWGVEGVETCVGGWRGQDLLLPALPAVVLQVDPVLVHGVAAGELRVDLAGEHVELPAAVLRHGGADGPHEGEGPQHVDVQDVVLRVRGLQPVLRRRERVEEVRERPHRVDLVGREQLHALLLAVRQGVGDVRVVHELDVRADLVGVGGIDGPLVLPPALEPRQEVRLPPKVRVVVVHHPAAGHGRGGRHGQVLHLEENPCKTSRRFVDFGKALVRHRAHSHYQPKQGPGSPHYP